MLMIHTQTHTHTAVSVIFSTHDNERVSDTKNLDEETNHSKIYVKKKQLPMKKLQAFRSTLFF